MTPSPTFRGYRYSHSDEITTRHGDQWRRDFYRTPDGGYVMDFTWLGMGAKPKRRRRYDGFSQYERGRWE